MQLLRFLQLLRNLFQIVGRACLYLSLNNVGKPTVKIFHWILVASFFFGTGVQVSAQVTEDYAYDPLGRLTQYKENGSTKTGYCYDDAGNRTTVTQNGGGADECEINPPPPPLLPPTSLQISSHPGGLFATWTKVSGATHYLLRVGGEILTVTAPPYYINGTSTFHWVRACNATFCSDYAYF